MRNLLAVSALALAVGAGSASAHTAGEWIVRAGATMVEPHEDSESLALNGTTLSLGGKTTQLGVDSNVQLGLTLNYMLDDQFSIELLAATPFKHVATGIGALQGLDIAEVKQLPPTLSLVYHFQQSGAWQQYVGIGINHTFFFEQHVTSAAATTLATLGLTNGKVSMDSSTGLSLQWGVDYHLSGNWLLNASARWIDINSAANITFSNGSKLAADVQIDPMVYSVGLGYAF